MASSGNRLHLLYELSRGLRSLVDLGDLLQYVTYRAREAFGAEGCALLLLDEARREFYFPVVSETDRAFERRLQEVRFPADSGIAGWVLAHDQAVLVPDASNDPRFFSGVDKATKMTTRAVLCAPLRAPTGNIGVIEVVNPAPESLTQDDLEFLETLAADVAAACEKALLYGRLRNEAQGLRRVCRGAGLLLVGVGLFLMLGALFRHLSLALPLNELPARALGGVLSVAVGGLLIAVARGWLIGRST
jgi:GAF domain-containing protein